MESGTHLVLAQPWRRWMRLSMVLSTLLAWPSAASRSEPMAGMATADPRALRIPVSAAISRVRREAVLRVQEGQERLRLCRRAMQELTEHTIDEVDRCLDAIAVSVDGGAQLVRQVIASVPRPQEVLGEAKLALDEAQARLRDRIDESVGKLNLALAQVRMLTTEMEDAEGKLTGSRRSRLPSFLKPKAGGMMARGRAREQIESLNERTLRNVLKFVQEQEGWEHVTTSENVTVYRKYLDLSGVSGIVIDGDTIVEGGRGCGEDSGRFACIKAIGVIDAPVEKVFELFLDNTRVHEYNEHCREIADIDRLSEDTKVTWSASGRYGPFRARDACTIVHYRKLKDGSLVVINRAAEHVKAPRSEKYVRSQVLLAGNVMRPHPTEPGKTLLVTLTHVNPGGCVDTKAGAAMINMITATSPVLFHRKVEVAARKAMGEDASRHHHHHHHQDQPASPDDAAPLFGGSRLQTLEHFMTSTVV